MQRKWAAHNSVHKTNLSGRPTVYKAACDVGKAAKRKAKTSEATG